MRHMRALASGACAAALMLAAVGAAEAAELVVYAAGAAKAAVTELAPSYERDSGRSLRLAFGTVGALRDRILAGEKADVAILSAAGIEALRKSGRATGETAPIGSVEVAVAVKKGASLPAIATEDELRAALLAARSIAYADPAHGATAGTHFARVLERLGIADAVKAKALVVPFGIEAVEAVAAGKAELGISQSSEIAPDPGVTLAGGLPGTLALRTVYVAAALADTEAARALVRFLASTPMAEAALRRAGFEPVVR
jgi:molybdate transport system substrate-binding protein